MNTPLALPPVPASPVDLDFSRLDDLQVRVTAVVGRIHLPISALLRAEPGHVLELDRKNGDPVDILVNDRLIGRGEIVVIGDRLGITMTEIIDSQD